MQVSFDPISWLWRFSPGNRGKGFTPAGSFCFPNPKKRANMGSSNKQKKMYFGWRKEKPGSTVTDSGLGAMLAVALSLTTYIICSRTPSTSEAMVTVG